MTIMRYVIIDKARAPPSRSPPLFLFFRLARLQGHVSPFPRLIEFLQPGSSFFLFHVRPSSFLIFPLSSPSSLSSLFSFFPSSTLLLLLLLLFVSDEWMTSSQVKRPTLLSIVAGGRTRLTKWQSHSLIRLYWSDVMNNGRYHSTTMDLR